MWSCVFNRREAQNHATGGKYNVVTIVRSIMLNRLKQKDSDQFFEKDIATNADIAATRTYVKRFIGRVRGWGISNIL